MKHRVALPLVVFLCIGSLTSLTAAERNPSIILIHSHDHGYADLGVQGSVTDIRTPNLDAMARDGVRFLRAYVSAPRCAGLPADLRRAPTAEGGVPAKVWTFGSHP